MSRNSFSGATRRRDRAELVGDEVAEAVDDRPQPLEHLDVGELLRGVDAARRERARVVSTPASRAACSTAAHPASTIRSARETCLPPPAVASNSSLTAAERLDHAARYAG